MDVDVAVESLMYHALRPGVAEKVFDDTIVFPAVTVPMLLVCPPIQNPEATAE